MFLPSNITLKFGDSGDFVSELQRRLAAVSCFNADAINGFYDGTTVNGVSQFQSMSGIRADGIAGPETLRRLNGVISGDNSSTATHNAEEEARRAQEQNQQLLMQQQLYEQQQAQLAQQQQAYDLQQAQYAQQQQQAYAQPQQPAPQAEVTYTHPQAAQPAHQTQPSPTAGDDVLARMLLGQQQAQQPAPHMHVQQPQQPPAHTFTAAPPPAPAPIAMQVLTPQPAAAPQPLHYAPVAVAVAAAAPAPEANAPLAPAAEPQRGLLGRAAQFVSEKIQQLHTYFEAKLPNHVMAEVKNIGLAMAQSGVKEASIPTGPEPQRGIEGQQRGPQQGQQRG